MSEEKANADVIVDEDELDETVMERKDFQDQLDKMEEKFSRTLKEIHDSLGAIKMQTANTDSNTQVLDILSTSPVATGTDHSHTKSTSTVPAQKISIPHSSSQSVSIQTGFYSDSIPYNNSAMPSPFTATMPQYSTLHAPFAVDQPQHTAIHLPPTATLPQYSTMKSPFAATQPQYTAVPMTVPTTTAQYSALYSNATAATDPQYSALPSSFTSTTPQHASLSQHSVLYEHFDSNARARPTCISQAQNNLPSEYRPMPMNSSAFQINSETRLDARRVLHDLPRFGGFPEEWPPFISTFKETTRCYGYTALENQMRLQKCLYGDAKNAVEPIMIYSEKLNDVISELENNFGRPERLIKSQLDKTRTIPPISENKLQEIVPLAMKVKSLVIFLEAAGASQHLCNPFLLDELTAKLPLSRRLEWSRKQIEIRPYATLQHFSHWLDAEARVINAVSDFATPAINSRNTSYNRTASMSHNTQDNRAKPNYVMHVRPTGRSCSLCSQNHSLSSCENFIGMSVDERWKTVKEKRMCFSCLNSGHNTFNCKNKVICNINGCQRKHNNLLHNEPPPPSVESPSTVAGDAQLLCTVNQLPDKNPKLFFKIIPVRLFGENGSAVDTFAYLDDGSMPSLIEDEVANQLGLLGRSGKITLQWFGNHTVDVPTSYVSFDIQGMNANCQRIKLNNFCTIKNLNLPVQSMNFDLLNCQNCDLTGLPISNYLNAKPTILIGMSNAYLGVETKRFNLGVKGPFVAETKLGWVVYGPKNNYEESITVSNVVLSIKNIQKDSEDKLMNDINNMVQNYFAIENMGIIKPKEKLLSNADKRALEIMTETTKKVGSRYEIGMLWKKDNVVLPDSFKMALKRLELLENKLSKDPLLAYAYENKIEEYLEKGYAYKLTADEIESQSTKIWYLPHFGVRNANKPGKLRLVFDAAAQVGGVSLNTELLSGPDMNQTLLDVLFKFREAVIAVCSDIREMFHRVDIRQEDQVCQRFLWRHGCSQNPLEVYQMRAMIFGATCSPTLAQHVKNINAKLFQEEYPKAAAAIIKKHYVDDYVDSFETENEAISVISEVIRIHQHANFELANFVSNSQSVLESLGVCEGENIEVDVNVNVTDKSERILGMFWNTAKDKFVFCLRFNKVPKQILNDERIPTKREMLSVVMSVFDPFGLLGQFVIRAKILLQEVWKSGTSWDTPIPDNIYRKWRMWFAELKSIERISVPRCYSLYFRTGRIELHMFSDASENAYAAVAYWRVEDGNGNIDIALVAAKTRCAPIKPMSIPRLELQAAILGVRLKSTIISGHSVLIDRTYYWSDSKTVIRWINSKSRRYKQFVEHRISEILEESDESQWNWIPTDENVADEATRARFPTNLDENSRWFQGPKFLRLDSSKWPIQHNEELNINETEDLEIRAPLFCTDLKPNLIKVINIQRFSNYSRLKRSMAWVFRFIQNCKKNEFERIKTELTPLEELKAECYLCSDTQKDAFSAEYTSLKSHKQVSRSSSLYTLNPILDNDKDVIRAEGRLQAASTLPLYAITPIILPKKHYLTEIIVNYYHRKFHHQNQDLISCEIRRVFWIPSLRSLVRKAKVNCQTCRINDAKPRQPIMAPLPKDRITPYISPFSYTGVDLFGPVFIKNRRNREKRWVSIFTCMTTRAIHLEICRDQSTDAFLLSLRNFINRRGVPVRIRSDCGTNFVGIENELKNVHDFIDHTAVQSAMSPLGIEWLFNCPKYPNAGGCWERLIGSVKRVLNTVLKEHAPHIETLQSVLCEAENIVNSRPLTDIPVTIDEPEPITPNHFLLGKPNSTQTPGISNWRLMCMRKQWRVSQQLKNTFWKQWILQYLPDLTRRAKWCQHSEPIKINDLVLVCEPDYPRSQWIRGKVVQTFEGKDGVIRTAEIVTAKNTKLRRPVTRLAVLDVEASCGESSKTCGLHGGENVDDQNHK